MRLVAAAAVVAVVLVATYAALGGGGFRPTRPPDPCAAQAQGGGGGEGTVATLERLGFEALNGTACELGVSREALLLSLTGDRELGVDRERRTAAFRAGLRRTIDDEQQAGRLEPAQAFLLRQAVEVLPIDAVLDQLFGAG